MSAEAVFNEKLDTLATALNIDLPGETAAKRFEKLHEITRNQELSQKTLSYSRFLKEMVVADAQSQKTLSPIVDNKPLVMDWLFANLVSGMANIYPDNNQPKVHHWLPVTYMRPFGQKGKGKTRALVDGVAFLENNTIDVIVKDVQFAHDRGDGYDLAIEAFFCTIEDAYANYRDTPNADMFTVAVAAFFITQSVRNPHPKHGFMNKTIRTIVSALIKNLDTMDAMFARRANVKYRLPISPYTPVRVRKLSNGARAFVLPVVPSVGFVLTDKPVSYDNARDAVNKHRRNIVLDAKREKGMLFGVSSKAAEAIMRNAMN